MSKELKKTIEKLDALGQKTSPSAQNETLSQRRKRLLECRDSYPVFLKTYFPQIAEFECADFQIEAANYIKNNPISKTALVWHRDAAKSTHADILIPIWLIFADELHNMLLIGLSQESSIGLLNDLRAQFCGCEGQEPNLALCKDLQVSVLKDSEAEIQLSVEIPQKSGFKRIKLSFIAKGCGQSLRGLRRFGNRPDYVVTDDIDTELCQNPSIVQRKFEWIKGAVWNLFGVKKDKVIQRYVHCNNLFDKNTITYSLMQEKDVLVSLQNALIPPDEKPENPTWKYDGWLVNWTTKYTLDYFKTKFIALGPVFFDKEYMNKAILDKKIFKPEQIIWKQIVSNDFTEIVLYCDPSAKPGKRSDFTAIVALSHSYFDKNNESGDDYFVLLDCFLERADVTACVDFLYQFNAKITDNTHVSNWIEECFFEKTVKGETKNVFAGKIFMKTLEARKQTDEPLTVARDRRRKEEKRSRIYTLKTFFETGQMVFNERVKQDYSMTEALIQMREYPKGNDDFLDAVEGAIHILHKKMDELKSVHSAPLNYSNNLRLRF